MLTKNAMGNLKSRYKAVLRKCNLLNTFGSLAIAGMLVVGAGVGGAEATEYLATDGGTVSGDYSNSVGYTTAGGTYNVTGDATVNYKLTLEGPSIFTTDNDSTLTMNDYLTQSLAGSDLSGVKVFLNNKGLVLGNSLTVGDLTFAEGTSLYLYTVKSDSGGTTEHLDSYYSAGDKTLITSSGKTVAFNGVTILNDDANDDTISNLTINGEGNVFFSGGNSITSGIVILENTGSSINDGTITITATPNINDTLNASVTAFTTGLTIANTTTNSGTINVTSGTLAVASGAELTSTGTIEVADGSTLTNAGTLIVTDTGTFTNAGAVTISDGAILSIGAADSSWVSTAISEAGLTASNYAIFATNSPYKSSTGGITVGNYQANASSGGDVYFGSNSLFVVNASNLGSDYALTGSSILADSGAGLLVSNVSFTNGDTAQVNIASGSSVRISEGAWGYGSGDDSIATANSNKLYFDSAFIDGTVVYNYDASSETPTSYSLSLTQVASSVVLPSVNTSLGGLLDAAVTAGSLPVFLGTASKLETAEATKIIESAAKVGVAGGVMNTSSNASGLGVTNVNNRTTLIGSSSSTTLTAQSGVLVASNDNYASDIFVAAVGDVAGLGVMQNGIGIWVQPMYQSTSADGLKSGDYSYGYDSDLFGVSVGADYTFAQSLRVGAAIHMGGGDSESSGDLSKTENDFDYYGFSFYGGYVFGNLGISADIGYTITSNDVTQKTTAGNLYTGDFDADTFTVGVNAEYKIQTSALDIIPHVGMRLNYVDVDSFNTKDSASNVVFHNKSSDATTFAIPVGVSFSKDIETGSGLTLRPRADIGVQFTMGDLKVDQDVTIPGVNGTASMESEIYDPVTFMGGVGVDLAKNNLNFALDYNLGASNNVTNHQVMATFSYKF